MTTQSLDIWVSGGSHDSPFYKFYTDIDGNNELPDLILSANQQYTFRRLNQSSSHPFYIKAQSPKEFPSQLLRFSGDGNINNGITGDEAFTVEVLHPGLNEFNIKYYCTSHLSMQGLMIVKSDIPSPVPSTIDETVELFIGRLYTAAFGRVPDEAGLQYWVNVVNDPLVSYKDVSQNFVNSTEFSAIASPNSSSDVFATALYQNVLGRAPDSSGLGYWTNQLNSGLQDRADILIGFAESPENVALYETLA